MKQITLFSIFLVLASCGERTQTASELLVADKDVDCPKQEIYLEDIADVDYIPLVTTDSILVNDYPPESVTPEGIAVRGGQPGELLLLDPTGQKLVGRVCRCGQGPEEYTVIDRCVVDWKRREVYIADYTHLKAYDFAGNYLRTLLTKEEIPMPDIRNLNADQLLCARERENCETPYRPYFTLSKADGRVDTLTSIELPRFIASNRTVLSNDGRSYNAHAFLPLLVGCADRMWLTALALDTIFQINPDRSLLPVMAPLRAPTRDEEAPLLHFRGINDRYIWLSWVRRNVTLQMGNMEAGMREDLRTYMYDRKAQTWCEPAYRCRAWSGFEPRYIFTDPLPYGYGLVMLNAMDLVEAYQNDELADERLREIASTLREDDNPVLMRLKFK